MCMSLGAHMRTYHLCFEIKKDEQYEGSAAQVCCPFYLFFCYFCILMYYLFLFLKQILILNIF